MNETGSVFSNEDSLVEVPYVETLFWKVLMLSPRFQGIMAYEWVL